MSLKILIVEDEYVIAYTIQEMLSDLGHSNSTVKNNFLSAGNSLIEEKFDLAILDINLEGKNEGIQLAQKCLSNNTPFFYLSSYTDRKTLDLAMETAPGAYVVKPFVEADLYTALSISLSKNKEKTKTFTLKSGAELINLDMSNLLYLEAEGVYTRIVCEEKSHLYRSSLQNTMEELPVSTLTQIHRSFVVNTKQIEKIRSNTVYIGNQKLPISRTYKKQIMEIFQPL